MIDAVRFPATIRRTDSRPDATFSAREKRELPAMERRMSRRERLVTLPSRSRGQSDFVRFLRLSAR